MNAAPRRPAPRVPIAPRDGSLAVSVVRFCRLLRAHGLVTAADAARAALAALAVVDITRRTEFRLALRLSLLQRPEDFPLFEFLFNAYWRLDGTPQPAAPTSAQAAPPPRPPAAEAPADAAEPTEPVASESVPDEADARPAARPAAATGFPAPLAVAESVPTTAAELERIARALAARLASRPSRRYAPHPRGTRIDVRATLRDSLRHGGVPISLAWRQPRPARAQLLLFCDVSRSMSPYTSLLLRFAAAVLRRVARVEVFLFATSLQRVTPQWRARQWDEIAGAIPGCGGGTRLGTCLEAFFRDYGGALLGTRTTCLVLSDGLDAGDPALLALQMRRLRQAVRQIIWLNPLLHLDGYAPVARGMAAALPHVDLFAAAHDLASLWRVTRALTVQRRPA